MKSVIRGLCCGLSSMKHYPSIHRHC
jgi:hypothetical protein